MSELYIIGGKARADAGRLKEWRQFEQAVVLKFDTQSGAVIPVLDYVSPPDACPEFPSVVFKAGSLDADRLYLCTQTEMLVYRRSDMCVESYVSLPIFNDLHHVAPTPRGTLLIAVTGLDMVVEITPEGEVVGEWNVLGADTWQRFSRDVDYRHVQSTKPHLAHPNFVFMTGGDVWTTRCDLNDAICLTKPDRRIDLSGPAGRPVEFVHDGVAANNRLYFTSVDGKILIADPDTLAVVETIDIGDILQNEYPLGWCRGIKILDQARVVVGFTRLRSTKFQDKVKWAKAQTKRLIGVGDYEQSLPLLPTRLCCLDLHARTMEWECDLEPYGMNAIFSIL